MKLCFWRKSPLSFAIDASAEITKIPNPHELTRFVCKVIAKRKMHAQIVRELAVVSAQVGVPFGIRNQQDTLEGDICYTLGFSERVPKCIARAVYKQIDSQGLSIMVQDLEMIM